MGVAVFALAVGLVVFVAVAYRRHWAWTGFAAADSRRPTGKTLWDWLSLLVVPAGLALAALYLSNAQSEREQARARDQARVDRTIAADRNRADVLRTYFTQMSDLVLQRGLATARTGSPPAVLATTLTTTVLPQLDGTRKGAVLRFLINARLINYEPFVAGAKVTLRGADLSGVRARGLDIGGADLTGADLRHADLRGATIGVLDRSLHDCASGVGELCGVIRAPTDPRGAKLEEVLLSDADLSNTQIAAAVLEGSDLRRVDLSHALMYEVSMDSTCLTGANFAHASMERVTFKYAEGADVDFSGADLDLIGFGRRDAIAQMADVTLTGAHIFPARLPPQWHAHAPDRAGRLTGTGGLTLSGAQKRRLCSSPPGLPPGSP